MPSPAGAQEAALATDRDKTSAQAQKPAEKVRVELVKGQWVMGRAGIADLLCCMALSRLLHSLSLSFPIRSGEQLPLLSLLEDDGCECAFSGEAGISDPSSQASARRVRWLPSGGGGGVIGHYSP